MNVNCAEVLYQSDLLSHIASFLSVPVDDTIHLKDQSGNPTSIALTLGGKKVPSSINFVPKMSQVCKQWKKIADSITDPYVAEFDKIQAKNPYWLFRFTNFVNIQTGKQSSQWQRGEKLLCMQLIFDRTVALSNSSHHLANNKFHKEHLNKYSQNLCTGLRELLPVGSSDLTPHFSLDAAVVEDKILGLKDPHYHRSRGDYEDDRLRILLENTELRFENEDDIFLGTGDDSDDDEDRINELYQSRIRKIRENPESLLKIKNIGLYANGINRYYSSDLSLWPVETMLCKNLEKIIFKQPTFKEIEKWIKHFPKLKSIECQLSNKAQVSAFKTLATTHRIWFKINDPNRIHLVGPFDFHRTNRIIYFPPGSIMDDILPCYSLQAFFWDLACMTSEISKNILPHIPCLPTKGTSASKKDE